MARIHIDDAVKYQSSLNGEWFQLKNDGDIATVQFMYDTYDELDAFSCHKVEVNGKDRYVDCLRAYDDPIDKCPFCAAGFPAKPVRFVLMYQHEDGKVKIWERGSQFISQMTGLFNRYTPLSNHIFEIERFGKAGSKETKYQVFPIDKGEPVDIHELEKPELLGGLILDKTASDMETYLQLGSFPEEGTVSPVAPVASTIPSRRGAPQETTNAVPQISRRGAAPQDEEVF